METITLRRESGTLHYRFDCDIPPACVLRSGAVVRIETTDAASGQLRPGRIRPFDRTRVNPVTGPVYVEGASPGDMLRARVLSIDLPPEGYVWVRPGLGFRTNSVQDAVVRAVRVQVESASAVFRDAVTLPLDPHVGTMGVAPAAGSIESRWPGDHGGNMDCAALKPGAIAWFPVFCPGALLSAGDVHAAMGDGEVGGTGVEVEALVTLEINVVSAGHRLHGPVIETPEGVEVFGHGPTTDDAAEAAIRRGLRLVRALYSLSEEEAYMVISMACNLRFCQIALQRVGVTLQIPRQLANAAINDWPVSV
jgi:amidase